MHRSFLLAICWIVSLVLVGTLARAQTVRVDPGDRIVLSEGDIGFRLDDPRGREPRGTLVVRIDGRWVEARFSSAVRPATRE